MIKKGRTIAPELPTNIPKEAKWLSGEGGGAWFCIKKNSSGYQISRYTPAGKKDCSRIFETTSKGFDESSDYKILHISHCALVQVEQNNKRFIFNLKE
jgi:hypothetical protein